MISAIEILRRLMRRRLLASVLLGSTLGAAGTAAAAEPTTGSIFAAQPISFDQPALENVRDGLPVSEAIFQPPDDDTLPPITVRPPREEPPRELPPIELEADAMDAPDPSGDAFDPNDLSLSYPDLTDLQFGQPGPFNENTGILRGTQSLFDTPVAGSIVTREVLNEKQAADMFQAMTNQVGVLMQRTAAGQSSPYIRGLTGNQVLILIDGIRLNNATFRPGANQYFNTIDPGMVDHIEVVRGAGSVLWGSDAIGGVINVVTRGPNVDRALCDGNYCGANFTQFYNTADSSPYSRMNVEGWAGSVGAFAGASFLNVRDLDTGWGTGRQPGTNYQQYAGDVRMNYLIDECNLLTASLQHLEQDDVPRSDRYPGFPGDRDNSNRLTNTLFFDPQQRDLAYLRWQSLDPVWFIDAATVTASYHRQKEVQTRGLPTTSFQETDVDSVGLSAVASKDLEAFGKLTAGTDWYYDDIDSGFGGTATGPIIPDDSYYRSIGAFLNWDVPLTEKLQGIAGVRYENIQMGSTPVVRVGATPTPFHITPTFDDWVAQAGLVYELIPCVHLVGQASEGFRAPNLNELTGNNPNVLQAGQDLPSLALTPEHSWTYEAGVKTNFAGLRTQTFFYWTELQDNIVAISNSPNVFQRANQDSILHGVEFEGELLLRYGWAVVGNFWYTYGKNQVTQTPLSKIPPTQGTFGLMWRDAELRGYFGVYTWLAADQTRIDPIRDATDERVPIGGTPGYGTVNLRCGRNFGACQQHRLSLSLENIFDEAYLVHGSGVFGTGATARFGYQWVR